VQATKYGVALLDPPTTAHAPDDAATVLLGSLIALFRMLRRLGDTSWFDLTWPQFIVLRRIRHEETDLRLTSMADALGYDISVLSRQVNTMIDQGLITRVRDPNDGRAWLLRLTDEGEARLQGTGQQWMTQMREWLTDFDDADITMCAQLIDVLCDGMYQAAKTSSPRPPIANMKTN